MLPAGLPAPVVCFVVHTVAQQLALCELLYTPSASKAALASQLHKVHGVDLDARTSAIPHLFDGYFLYLTVDICHVDAGSPQRACALDMFFHQCVPGPVDAVADIWIATLWRLNTEHRRPRAW